MNIRGTGHLKNDDYNKIILTDFKGLHCNVSGKYEEFLFPEVDISDKFDTLDDDSFLYQMINYFLTSNKISKVSYKKMKSSGLYSFIVESDDNKSFVLSFNQKDLKYKDHIKLIMDKYYIDRDCTIMGNDYDKVNIDFSFEDTSYSLNNNILSLVLNYNEKDFVYDFIQLAVSESKKILFIDSYLEKINKNGIKSYNDDLYFPFSNNELSIEKIITNVKDEQNGKVKNKVKERKEDK